VGDVTTLWARGCVVIEERGDAASWDHMRGPAQRGSDAIILCDREGAQHNGQEQAKGIVMVGSMPSSSEVHMEGQRVTRSDVERVFTANVIASVCREPE
jgi:hypothetical protein